MMPTISESARQWIDHMLAQMTPEQKIGQLLIPMLGPVGNWSDPHKEFKGVQPGAIHMLPGTAEELSAANTRMQEYCDIPALITGDLENGAGSAIKGATSFPSTLSMASSRDKDLAYQMGRASAIDGRACGFHWSFGPVVDINATPHSPIVNTRSFGDNPDLIIDLSTQVLRGMQDNGLIATAKHFPGDGFDDRDQHICTTVNPLSIEDWLQLSGRTFQAAIDAGVMTIMAGHIALPSFDPGPSDDPDTAPPAPASYQLITELLRQKMGFQGLVVTDGLNMGGIIQWADRATMLTACINAGCDMLLFVDAPRDFKHLVNAFEAGLITEERINQSVERVLRLKAHVGLHQSTTTPPRPQNSRQQFEATSQTAADKSLTIVRDRNQTLPLQLGPGKKILSFHLRSIPAETNVDQIDALLAATGAEVVRATENDCDNLPTTDTIDSFYAVIMHFVFESRWMTGCIRPNGLYMGAVAGIIGLRHPKTITISYGSPYIHHETPAVPACINAYSSDIHSQQAVLKLLQGEITAQGTSPVILTANRDINDALVTIGRNRSNPPL